MECIELHVFYWHINNLFSEVTSNVFGNSATVRKE